MANFGYVIKKSMKNSCAEIHLSLFFYPKTYFDPSKCLKSEYSHCCTARVHCTCTDPGGIGHFSSDLPLAGSWASVGNYDKWYHSYQNHGSYQIVTKKKE